MRAASAAKPVDCAGERPRRHPDPEPVPHPRDRGGAGSVRLRHARRPGGHGGGGRRRPLDPGAAVGPDGRSGGDGHDDRRAGPGRAHRAGYDLRQVRPDAVAAARPGRPRDRRRAGGAADRRAGRSARAGRAESRPRAGPPVARGVREFRIGAAGVRLGGPGAPGVAARRHRGRGEGSARRRGSPGAVRPRADARARRLPGEDGPRAGAVPAGRHGGRVRDDDAGRDRLPGRAQLAAALRAELRLRAGPGHPGPVPRGVRSRRLDDAADRRPS